MKKPSARISKAKKLKATRAKFTELHDRITVILRKHPEVRGCAFYIDIREKRLVLHVHFPYIEEKHEGRSFSIDSDYPKLNHLKVSEANLLGSIASEAAEGDFDVVLVPDGITEDGELEYEFTLKK